MYSAGRRIEAPPQVKQQLVCTKSLHYHQSLYTQSSQPSQPSARRSLRIPTGMPLKSNPRNQSNRKSAMLCRRIKVVGSHQVVAMLAQSHLPRPPNFQTSSGSESRPLSLSDPPRLYLVIPLLLLPLTPTPQRLPIPVLHDRRPQAHGSRAAAPRHARARAQRPLVAVAAERIQR